MEAAAFFSWEQFSSVQKKLPTTMKRSRRSPFASIPPRVPTALHRP